MLTTLMDSLPNSLQAPLSAGSRQRNSGAEAGRPEYKTRTKLHVIGSTCEWPDSMAPKTASTVRRVGMVMVV